MITFNVKNRFTGEIQFTAKINCKKDESTCIKLRLAVLWAIENKANLSWANLSGANLSRANLSWADLSWADLSWADLSGANLSGADLSGANLSRADLSGANLSGADLLRADLSWADLSWANLSRVNLSGADLSGANLSRANLSRVNLSGADLSGANLSRANLSRADLSRADLSGANLSRADLSGASGLEKRPPQTVILPAGELHVFKKLNEGIAEIIIPVGAKRSNAAGRKCRAEFAIVKELPEGCAVGTSKHDSTFEYRVGETVRPHEWCDDWKNECAGGIHFFLTREEAEEY